MWASVGQKVVVSRPDQTIPNNHTGAHPCHKQATHDQKNLPGSSLEMHLKLTECVICHLCDFGKPVVSEMDEFPENLRGGGGGTMG